MTRPHHPRLSDDQRGIVAIEFALFMPILILLLIGLIDVGRVFHRQMVLDRAVRAAADYAVVVGASADSLVAVREAVERVAPADPTGTRVISTAMACLCGVEAASCSQFCGNGQAPDAYINVGLEETVEAIIPYPHVGQAIRVTSATTVRVN
jgi:Flp pilus assembly protein TadG